jgi:hypothetical protein
MARTAQEIIAEREANKAAPQRTAQEIIALRNAPFEPYVGGPTTAEAIGDVGLAAAEGFNTAGEFAADVIKTPLDLTMRNIEGYKQAFTGDKGNFFSRMYEGFMTPPSINIDGEEKELGEITRDVFNPDELTRDQYAIPEGEGPSWLKPAKTIAKTGTELLATAPMGGPKYLLNALKAAGGGTAGAVVGEQLGGDTGKMVGTIAGALASDPRALVDLVKAMARGGAIPFKAIHSYLTKTDPNMANATETELRAGWEYAMKNIHPKDPDITDTEYMRQLERKLAENTDPGTTGQIMDDTGLLNMERIKADELNRRDLDIQNNLIEQQALAPLEDIAPTGITADAAKEPRNFVQTLKAQNEATAQAGETAALQAETASVAPFANKKTAEQGSAMQKSVQALKEESEAVNSALWAEIGNPQMTGDDVLAGAKGAFSGMLDYTKAELKRQMGDAWQAIERMGGEVGGVPNMVDFEGMNAAISGLSKASSDMPGAAKQVVGKVIDALYDSLGGPAGTARRKAADTYKQHMDKFGPKSTTGKLLDAEPEEFGTKLIGGKDAGLAKTRAVQEATGGGAELAAQQDDVIRGAFNQMQINPETGRVSPQAINSFIKQYGDQMSPTLRAEIDAAQAAGRGSEQAGTVAKELRKEAGAADRTTAGKFADTDDATIDIIKRFDEVMKPGGKRSERLKELIEATGGDAQALEDLRKAGIDRLSAHITDDAGGLTVKATEKFLQDRQALEASGLYSKWELDQIQEGLKTGEKKFLHDLAKKRPKAVAAENEIFNALAALGGAKAGAYAFGSPLIGAAIGRRIASKMAKRVSSDQAEAFAYEMSVNPEIMLDMLKKFKGKKPNAEVVGQIVDEMVARAIQGTVVGVE